MKIILAYGAALSLTIASSVSIAATTFEEGFNYADSTVVAGNNGWAAHSGAGANSVTAITASNLSLAGVPSLAGGSGALFGHRSGSSEDINHSLGAVSTSAGSTIYASFLFRVDQITATAASTEATVPFMADTSNWPLRMYVVSNTSTSTYTLGIRTHRGGGTQPVAYVPTEFTTGTTHRVVVGLEFNAGATDDVAKIWVNPPASATAPTPHAQQIETVAEFIPTLIAIRQGSSQRMTISIDDIRVSNSWADVTPGTPVTTVQDWNMY